MVCLKFGLHKGLKSLIIMPMVLSLDIEGMMEEEKEQTAYHKSLNGSINKLLLTRAAKTQINRSMLRLYEFKNSICKRKPNKRLPIIIIFITRKSEKLSFHLSIYLFSQLLKHVQIHYY